MAEESRKKEDLDRAKAAPKPMEAAAAMPDGSDKSAYVPTGPEQAVAAAETPAEAAAAPVEEKAPEPKVKDEVEIQIDLLKEKDWFRRKEAATTLGEMGDERAVASLITALRDDEWNVREAAEDALAMIGSPAVEPLIKALREYQTRR
ncbi:MAG: HEAT repeat domain-containing protein, partial [Nitrospirae bacterium]|nr:HEAT repeat domain-containing protein [Nitrospirota bacterium]